MVIISKYKDYYDYLMGIYGRDEKLVLDRREGKVIKDLLPTLDGEEFRLHRLAIFGWIYEFVVNREGKWYWGESLEEIGEKPSYPWEMKGYYIKLKRGRPIKYLSNTLVSSKPYKLKKYDGEIPFTYFPKEGKGTHFPRLKDFPITSIIPAETMYQNLSTWLSSKKETPTQDKMTNKEKIKSHGFDIVKSFRNMKR